VTATLKAVVNAVNRAIAQAYLSIPQVGARAASMAA